MHMTNNVNMNVNNAKQAGLLALPTLIKMAAVVRGSNQEWDGMEELPLEVPLPAGLRYHSMFSCPVTREPRCVFILTLFGWCGTLS